VRQDKRDRGRVDYVIETTNPGTNGERSIKQLTAESVSRGYFLERKTGRTD